MTETVQAFDAEVPVETARVTACAIGTGVAVTVALIDPEDTTIIAATELVPGCGFDMDRVSEVASRLIESTRARLAETVTPDD